MSEEQPIKYKLRPEAEALLNGLESIGKVTAKTIGLDKKEEKEATPVVQPQPAKEEVQPKQQIMVEPAFTITEILQDAHLLKAVLQSIENSGYGKYRVSDLIKLMP